MERVDWYIQIDNTEDMLFTYDEQEKQSIEKNRENSKNIFSPEFIPYYLEEAKIFKLTPSDTIIYWFIRYYMKNSKWRFFFESEDIWTMLNMSVWTVDNSFSKLNKLWLIDTWRKVKAWWWTIRFIKWVKTWDDLIKWWGGNISTSLNNELQYLTKQWVTINKNKNKNNIHSLTSNEVNSFIDNSFTNELLVNKNNDIVELDNKESSFVELNNKNTWIKNSNCKEKENKIKESTFDANEVFDKLWNFYPWKKNAKEAARTYFKKKIKTQYDLDLLRYALPLYISTVSDKNYLVLLRTYLSEERYKDYEQQFKNTNKTLEKEIKQQDNEWFKLKFNRTYEN